MDVYYVYNEEMLNLAINDYKEKGFEVNKTTVQCTCGETQGAYFLDENDVVAKVICCEACYNNASFHQRYI